MRMLARKRAGATRQDQHERKTIMNHFKYPTSESAIRDGRQRVSDHQARTRHDRGIDWLGLQSNQDRH
jgi:hypothetical protein